jgi:hypothetical protein
MPQIPPDSTLHRKTMGHKTCVQQYASHLFQITFPDELLPEITHNHAIKQYSSHALCQEYTSTVHKHEKRMRSKA